MLVLRSNSITMIIVIECNRVRINNSNSILVDYKSRLIVSVRSSNQELILIDSLLLLCIICIRVLIYKCKSDWFRFLIWFNPILYLIQSDNISDYFRYYNIRWNPILLLIHKDWLLITITTQSELRAISNSLGRQYIYHHSLINDSPLAHPHRANPCYIINMEKKGL